MGNETKIDTIIETLRQDDFNSWELNKLKERVAIEETRALAEEGIKEKKQEIENLEKRVKAIDDGTYEEPMEDNDNYYENR